MAEKDKCPKCGAEVPAGAQLGQGQWGEGEVNPEPWYESASCPNCRAQLRRNPGEAWIVASARYEE